MKRYKTRILLLICFTIFAILLQRQWKTLRVYSKPIDGLNDIHDKSVDRISVQNAQRVDLREVLGETETMDTFEDLDDNIQNFMHHNTPRTDNRDGIETSDDHEDIIGDKTYILHQDIQRTDNREGTEAIYAFDDLNGDNNSKLHQNIQNTDNRDRTETIDSFQDLNYNTNDIVHRSTQRTHTSIANEIIDSDDTVDIYLNQQTQRIDADIENTIIDVFEDLNNTAKSTVHQPAQQTTQSTNYRDENEDIDGYKQVNLNTDMKINESTFHFIDPQTIIQTKCKLCRTSQPVFIDDHKPFVALASFPGSGNSWTRELLEYITGVYTGSVYVDSWGHFRGSRRCPLRGGVYIVKTHKPGNGTSHWDCNKIEHRAKIDYQKAMFLLRNPYDAILSSFNLIYGGKVDFASQETFERKWQKFVKTRAKMWQTMTQYWIATFERPLHIIVYEQLREQTPSELLEIGKFLHLNTTYIDTVCAKLCLKQKYHREKPPEWMNASYLYNDDSRNIVNEKINDVINAVDNKNEVVKVLKSYVKDTGI